MSGDCIAIFLLMQLPTPRLDGRQRHRHGRRWQRRRHCLDWRTVGKHRRAAAPPRATRECNCPRESGSVDALQQLVFLGDQNRSAPSIWRGAAKMAKSEGGPARWPCGGGGCGGPPEAAAAAAAAAAVVAEEEEAGVHEGVGRGLAEWAQARRCRACGPSTAARHDGAAAGSIVMG